MPLPLEVAVFSPASALLAQAQGAGRVELNAPGSYGAGGTTPSLYDFSSLSLQMTIPIRLMIRPRGPPTDGSHDFLYTEDEFEVMKNDIQRFLSSGDLNLSRGDGFIFGILKEVKSGTLQVDRERCSQLTQLAHPFPCVFHRAFDPIASTHEWPQQILELEAAGFRGLLTSGGGGGMCDNLPRLGEIATAGRQNIELVAGGGLRAQSFTTRVGELLLRDKCSVWLHTAALVRGEDGQATEATEEADAGELKALLAKMGEASLGSQA